MATINTRFESQKKQIYNGKIAGVHLLDQCLVKEINGEIVDYKLPIDPDEEESIVGYYYFDNNINYDNVLTYNDHLLVDFKSAFSLLLIFY